MTISVTPQTSFLTEINTPEAVIPPAKLVYFRERFRDRLYELVVSEFLKKESAKELNRSDLARRIGRKPEQITRWLGAPGNWTLETVSDLLLGISKAELDFFLTPVEKAARNYAGPDWLKALSRQKIEINKSSSSENTGSIQKVSIPQL